MDESTLDSQKTRWDHYFEDQNEALLEEWKTFLRFPSISADPAYHASCHACVDWLNQRIGRLGFTTALQATSGLPILVASRSGTTTLPHIVVYGHYDVQPVQPRSLWTSDPFEPELRDGRLHARGAQDNKGQLSMLLSALEALIQHQELHCPVSLIIEGEEECGSQGITDLLRSGKWVPPQGDILLVCDFTTLSPEVATITAGLRGMVHLEVALGSLSHDLHSGYHGGMVKNPVAALCKLVTLCTDQDGRITIPGYYDGITEPSSEERVELYRLPFSSEAYQALTGAPPTGGEKEFSPLLRQGFRPTIEINGMWGGYTGDGAKTIIPAEARVKLSSRLARGQDPDRCLALLKQFLQDHTPPEFTLRWIQESAVGEPLSIELDNPFLKQVEQTFAAQYGGARPYYFWSGASIPVLKLLVEKTSAAPILLGFGLDDDRIHSPNESFAVAQFKKGFLFMTSYFSQLKG